MATAGTKKPVRVERAKVKVFDCQVCGVEVQGEVEVEVHLGDVRLDTMIEEDGDARVEATAEASTRIRALTVAHSCRQDAIADPTTRYAGDPEA
jgi:hypothetical protein